jgi:hypothetical protein
MRHQEFISPPNLKLIRRLCFAMRTLVPTCVLLAFLALHAPGLRAQSVCPTGNESTRTLVEIVLGGEGYADERAEIGMPTTDPSQIQMLQAPEDEAACQFLNEEVSVGPDGPKWLKAYYKAGDFYFVALRYQRETLIYFGYGYVLILNSDLEGLKVFAV